MQLGLAHRSLETEQETIVEQRRVINAVGVADQCICDPGKIDETIPVGIIAGEARHLKTKDQSDPGERDFGAEPSKSRARDISRREAEILVNDNNPITGPS